MNKKTMLASLLVVLSLAVMTTVASTASAEKENNNAQRFQWGFTNGCKDIVVPGGHSDAYNAGFKKGQSGDGCSGSAVSTGDNANTQAQDAKGNPECVQHCTSAIDQSNSNGIPQQIQQPVQPTPTTANPACKFICF